MYASSYPKMAVFSKSRRRLCYGGSAVTYHRILPSWILRKGDLFALRRARFISRTHGDFSRWVRIWSGDERYSYAIPFKDSGTPGYGHFLKRLWKTLRSRRGWWNSVKINSRTYCYCAESNAWILLASLRGGKRDMNHRNDTAVCRTVTYFALMVRYGSIIW